MAIGKNSRRSSVRSSIRAPKFLDKSSGFYGRLDEPEVTGEEVERSRGKEVEDDSREAGVVSGQSPRVEQTSGADEMGKPETFGFCEGMTEDDGETLLRRKPSRLSSRWRRSSRKKQREGGAEGDERPGLRTEGPVGPRLPEGTGVMIEVEVERTKTMDEEREKTAAGGKDHPAALAHFACREDADDQVLIRDKKRGREEEGAEERRMKREQEEGMKVVKRNAVKSYRKTLDRAFRRGWEAFVANLYSVTLTPVASSSPPSASSPSPREKLRHKQALAECR